LIVGKKKRDKQANPEKKANGRSRKSLTKKIRVLSACGVKKRKLREKRKKKGRKLSQDKEEGHGDFFFTPWFEASGRKKEKGRSHVTYGNRGIWCVLIR